MGDSGIQNMEDLFNPGNIFLGQKSFTGYFLRSVFLGVFISRPEIPGPRSAYSEARGPRSSFREPGSLPIQFLFVFIFLCNTVTCSWAVHFGKYLKWWHNQKSLLHVYTMFTQKLSMSCVWPCGPQDWWCNENLPKRLVTTRHETIQLCDCERVNISTTLCVHAPVHHESLVESARTLTEPERPRKESASPYFF